MIEITDEPISPEFVIDRVKTRSSGCVVTYVGLIRDQSNDKPVRSVKYQDARGKAADRLREVAHEAKQKWQINNIAIYHRTGELMVGDINLVVAVSSTHRQEGFSACQHIIDHFKQALPTQKIETYQDGSIQTKDA